MEGYVYLLRCEQLSVFDAGTGWQERWLPPDPEMGRPQEVVALTRCAWAGQWMVYPDGDIDMLPTAEVLYNRAHTGRRIWIGDRFPTAAERAAAPWKDGEGALVWAPAASDPPTAPVQALSGDLFRQPCGLPPSPNLFRQPCGLPPSPKGEGCGEGCGEDYCEIRME